MKVVLSMYACAQGFAFTVFEDMLPLYWGFRESKEKDDAPRMEVKIETLLLESKPDIVVLRKYKKGSGTRHRTLSDATRKIAEQQGAEVVEYTRFDIQRCFRWRGAKTRHETIDKILDYVPQFRGVRPNVYKFWEKEDNRMFIFDAVALVVTYYSHSNVPTIQF